MEGKLPFSTRGFTTLWKGRMDGNRVALKILRLGPEDDKSKIATVSCNLEDRPQFLTFGTTRCLEILQGSSLVAPPQSPKRTSCLRFLDIYFPVLHNLTMDGERKYP
jgi:hypothetical protein